MSAPAAGPAALSRVTSRVSLHHPASHAGIPSPKQARIRRATFFTFVFLGTIVGAWLMYLVLSRYGMHWHETGLLIVFVPLFYQLNTGFWTALLGIWMMNRPKPDPLDLMRTIPRDDMDSPLGATTAIIVPVYNEDVTRVFEGVRAVYNSLLATGRVESFDFFILSDSDDPNKWIEEEAAWLELCRQHNAFGRIFYRKRRAPINRKSGNVSDFCRRWGKRYRYMIVLDADSLMAGKFLVNLVRIMEKNPGIGILQTFPKQIGATTLLGRVMQFGQALYGPAFVAGLNYWQCGEANFWGHNAIVRLAPFIEYCALPALPGKEPLGGHILSHDFVEAALMRKAGQPPALLADLCQRAPSHQPAELHPRHSELCEFAALVPVPRLRHGHCRDESRTERAARASFRGTPLNSDAHAHLPAEGAHRARRTFHRQALQARAPQTAGRFGQFPRHFYLRPAGTDHDDLPQPFCHLHHPGQRREMDRPAPQTLHGHRLARTHSHLRQRNRRRHRLGRNCVFYLQPFLK
ncbi:MAG: glucans biosynthesis glucosyltransferase MdoH [Verrucomicrobia bacterium]|nr:glucans biosynthesis glucosyltransferase MdoH [Verrucomicrobiota bacterium]